MSTYRVAVLALIALAAAANAEVGDRWPVLASASDHDCQMAITNSGRAMQIRAEGMIPGETLRLTVTNGDMKPIALSLRASNTGTFQRYYLPFRFNRDGGQVGVTLIAARCTLGASAPWTRGVPTIF